MTNVKALADACQRLVDAMKATTVAMNHLKEVLSFEAGPVDFPTDH